MAKINIIISLLLISFCFSFFTEEMPTEEITLSFYSEKIVLEYHPEIRFRFDKKLEESSIVAYYEALENAAYEPLLRSLTAYKQKLALNDWLFYQLVRKGIEQIYAHHTQKEKTLATWFYVSKLGYDTRLAFLKNEAYIYVRTNDQIYETPLIEDKGKRFVGLTEMQYKRTKNDKAVYLLNFLAAPNGQPFSFSLHNLPKLKPTIQQKKYRFSYKNEPYEITAQCDRTLVEIMKTYPVIAETDYVETPFSTSLKQSLLPQIKTIIQDRNLHETLEILTTFTRSAFNYKEDEAYFGRSKPMIRDEVFFYPYSDCEDRSAVFYGLVEELLGLPMIIVAFPDHLTVAVALDEPIGPSIRYKGKKFYICDPTGPNNSSEIGNVPKGYEKQSFHILLDNVVE